MENRKKLMAIDLGTKRIGVAISDESLTISQPFCVLKREGNKRDIAKVIEIIKAENINKVIIGIPIRDGGSPLIDSAKRFGLQLKEAIDVDIEYIDETMTTFDAKEILRMAGVTEKKGRDIIDKIAASKILESYLKNRAEKNK